MSGPSEVWEASGWKAHGWVWVSKIAPNGCVDRGSGHAVKSGVSGAGPGFCFPDSHPIPTSPSLESIMLDQGHHTCMLLCRFLFGTFPDAYLLYDGIDLDSYSGMHIVHIMACCQACGTCKFF